MLWAWLSLNLCLFPGLAVVVTGWAASFQTQVAEEADQLVAAGREEEAYALTQGDSVSTPIAGALLLGLGAVVVLNTGLLVVYLLRRALTRRAGFANRA